MQVPIKLMLDHAKEKGYMLSRFLITNLESIEALTNAAKAKDSPFLYDIYFPLMEKSCLSCVEELAKRFISEIDLPSGLFADHVESVDLCIKAIDRGYSGVMIDLSKLSLIENISGTKEVVDYAHKKGVFVEGEVGVITRSSAEEVVETDPEQAKEYITKTGVDCLAISIGVHSGFYEGEPVINYNLIRQLSNLGTHLCLHGASGLSREVMQRCILLGMHVTGYGTDPLFKYFGKIDEIRKKEGARFVDPSRIILPARDEMQKEIEEKISYIKSEGQAREIISLYKNLSRNQGLPVNSLFKAGEKDKLQTLACAAGSIIEANNNKDACSGSCLTSSSAYICESNKNDDFTEKLIKDITNEVLKRINSNRV